MSEYKLIKGQCGTCRFAACFDFGPSPSGPEDGVHCTSEEQAKMMDEMSGLPEKYNQEELKEYGYIDIFRLEAVAEEVVTCQNWEPSEQWLEEQIPPQLSGH